MTAKDLMEQICQLGQIHLEGNVVPPSWYQHLKYPSGKPYHIAITLFSEIVYWFRPRMVRDERTGEFVGWQKKFKGDGIQRGYAAWGAPFGFTKREAADAIKYLVAEGLITTEIRDVTLPDGTLRPNVVVVTSVSPTRLREITYTRRHGGPTPERTTATGYNVETDGVIPQDVTPPSGYNISGQDLLPGVVGPSSDDRKEGATARGTCLETMRNNNLEIKKDASLHTGTKFVTSPHTQTDGNIFSIQFSEGTAQPETISTTGVQSATLLTPITVTPTVVAVTPQPTVMTTEAKRSDYPAVLIKTQSRRAVLELGQRPTREDFIVPNVVSACAWAAKTWKLALVRDVAESETPVLVELLARLEDVLASIRERALRLKQITFTQLLDDYLGPDDALRACLRDAPTPQARLAEFTSAVLEVDALWTEAPSDDDLAALRAFLDSDAAA
jgi:hypothetical protein